MQLSVLKSKAKHLKQLISESKAGEWLRRWLAQTQRPPVGPLLAVSTIKAASWPTKNHQTSS